MTSTSKTKKIILTKKNFMQKGSRLTPYGSNPHSKGDIFSLSLTVLRANTDPNNKIQEINQEIII